MMIRRFDSFTINPLSNFLRKFWVTILWLTFIAIFFLSTASYQLKSSHKSHILLFPSASSEYDGQDFSHLYAEQRKVPVPQVLPAEWSLEERKIYYLAKELLYGPGARMIRSYPFVPKGTRLQSLALQDNDLYIDFDATLLKAKSEHHFNTDAILALFEQVLRLNFPGLKGIYFTVEGMSVKRFRQKLSQAQQAEGFSDKPIDE